MRLRAVVRERRKKSFAIYMLLALCMLLLSACGGNPQTQARANQLKQALDGALAHAQSIGVPSSLLQPIIQQEHLLNGTHAPLALFGDQPVDTYYSNVVQRYLQLTSQVIGLETQVTQQFDYQTTLDLQNMSQALTERQRENFVEARPFATRLTTYQQELASAQYPKDYTKISLEARNATQSLHLMGPTYTAYTQLQQIIQQLKSSKMDVTALTQQAQSDLQIFRSAAQPEDFSHLIDLINTQLDETSALSTQIIPYVGQVKLNQFKADIQLIKQYNGNVSKYQQHLDTDQQALDNAKSVGDYLKVSAQIDADISSIQFPLTVAQTDYLLQQFHQEVTSWGHSHQYLDKFNGQSYPLDYEYDLQGIGSDADYAVQSAQTMDDYLSAIDLINNDFRHLHMMEQDYSDNTPFNQPHQSDFTLMNHYGVSNAGEVLIVSLVEQTLRYYQNGTLVRAFHITSGQFDKPSPPGFWQIIDRESPTTFKSSEPKGSAFWYPDTKINFAMEYHSGGYFFHDSWWRADYGVGTNFPHYDSGGDESFAGNGSHGCINMAENDISWLYPNSNYSAQVIVY